jgi:hypothetical protein
MEKASEHILSFYHPSENLNVDEGMNKGKQKKNPIRQREPNKPIRLGPKIWMLVDAAGICLMVILYNGMSAVVTNLTNNTNFKELKVMTFTKDCIPTYCSAY